MRTGAALALILLSAAPALPVAAAPPTSAEYVLQFTHALAVDERADLLALGVVPEDLSLFPGAVARLTPAQADAVARRPYVERLDREEAIELHVDSS
ncbi:MAG TPA: hypothetical protein VI997_00020, partial [Candidatus Thermoplasmatota archaeon]|nr:hypothetical protein [Candidatus Thermoplasmatota archaeon]